MDSLIYESKVSRQCNEVVTSLIGNSEKEREIDKRQYALDKSKMKQKIKKRNGLILIEGFAILGLILLL